MDLTPFQLTLWSTFISVSGWLVGNRMRIGTDAASKRTRFQSFVELLAEKIKAKQANELAFCSPAEIPMLKGIPTLEKEVVEVLAHIRCKRKKRFNEVFNAYKNIGFEIADPKKCDEIKVQMLSLLKELHASAE